jgi:hypothetical protein
MTQLVLGDFVFQDMEVPESLPFGGGQMLSVKKLVGGARVIDVMGVDPDPIEWTGFFFPTSDGSSALDRAMQVQELKDSGVTQLLSFDELLFNVVIREFKPNYKLGHIPYKITLEVLEDLSSAGATDALGNIDDDISDDMYAANTLAADVPSITSSVSTLVSDINAIGSLVSAAYSVVAPLIQSVSAIISNVSTLSLSTDETLASASAPGGMSTSNTPAVNLAAYEAQLAANNTQTSLVQLQGLLGRILKNLQLVNSSIKTVTVSGGNLFDIAAKQYGDPTAWTLIASANGLTDPTITGIVTLTIPPYVSGTGVLES